MAATSSRSARTCLASSSATATPEGEPPLPADYRTSTTAAATPLRVTRSRRCSATSNEHLELCGVSGWYTYQGSAYRDTDWFEVIIGTQGYIDATVDAEFQVYLFELGPQDCGSVAVLQQQIGGVCSPSPSVQVFGTPGDIVWLWVGPTVFAGPEAVFSFDYILTIDGLVSGVALEPASWSGVKELYR